MTTPMEADYPLPAFYFKVTFSEKEDEDAAFQEISGISAQIETEPYSEGGENRFIYQLPKPVKHPKLVLKRGISPATSPLVTWCQSVFQDGFNAPIQPKLLHVYLLDAEGQAACKWSFADAYPVNWEVESFNATKNQVAIEKIEIAYSYSQREL